jgi:putative spermidine/putrescine transport system ATP-binding protein
MALADLMVVMEDGHIRQAGAPRDVFERPQSAFVARFIGGHNVLPGEHGLIAVRADRCRLKEAANGQPHLSGRIAAVEYQGPVVRVVLKTDQGEGATALVPDSTFYARPMQPGDPAMLVWSADDAHRLSDV